MTKTELKRYIANKRSESMSYKDIATALNKMNERTPQHNKPFTTGSAHFHGGYSEKIARRRSAKPRPPAPMRLPKGPGKWDIVKMLDESSVFDKNTKKALIQLIMEHGL